MRRLTTICFLVLLPTLVHPWTGQAQSPPKTPAARDQVLAVQGQPPCYVLVAQTGPNDKPAATNPGKEKHDASYVLAVLLVLALAIEQVIKILYFLFDFLKRRTGSAARSTLQQASASADKQSTESDEQQGKGATSHKNAPRQGDEQQGKRATSHENASRQGDEQQGKGATPEEKDARQRVGKPMVAFIFGLALVLPFVKVRVLNDLGYCTNHYFDYILTAVILAAGTAGIGKVYGVLSGDGDSSDKDKKSPDKDKKSPVEVTGTIEVVKQKRELPQTATAEPQKKLP